MRRDDPKYKYLDLDPESSLDWEKDIGLDEPFQLDPDDYYD